MSLQKQIWIDQLLQKYYPEGAFLTKVRDFSALTENDKINLADVGLDPEVYINNTTYPIGVVERIDTPISIELDLFETKNTLVRRPEAVELAYDKLESVLFGHKNALLLSTSEKAIHAIAPQLDAVKTPVLETTGDDNGSGKKRLTIADLLKLKRRFDEAEIRPDKRVLVLTPSHVEDLLLADTKIFKSITNHTTGTPLNFAGFEILEFSRMPKYDSTTLAKIAHGATNPNETECSVAFQGDEVMKADGNVHMYASVDDPKERATTVGFDKRFICMPLRNQGIGAVLSATV